MGWLVGWLIDWLVRFSDLSDSFSLAIARMLARLRLTKVRTTVEPRFNEVAGDRPNLFVKWRFRYIENLDITNTRGNDQNVRYIEVIVND